MTALDEAAFSAAKASLMAMISNSNTGHIRPDRLAALLQDTATGLAELAHVHRTTMERCPGDPQVQAGLIKIVDILAAAATFSAQGTPIQEVIKWFCWKPLSGFGRKTARDLVRAGRQAAVMEHLERLACGGYA